MTDLASGALRIVGQGGDIPEGTVVPYYVNDLKRRISVARVDDRLYAFEDLCTCDEQACPLSGGLLTGTTIMCQCHGTQFDIKTGAVVRGAAAIEPLDVYAVQEVEGSVQLRT